MMKTFQMTNDPYVMRRRQNPIELYNVLCYAFVSESFTTPFDYRD